MNIGDCESGDQNTTMGEVTHLDVKDYDKVGQPLQENGMGTSRADLLSKLELHPVITQKVLPIFEKGIYDPAVLEAFKQVEIAVREAGGYTKADYGNKLMSKAFAEVDGNLTDPNQHPDEKNARKLLFLGVIGAYKTPVATERLNSRQRKPLKSSSSPVISFGSLIHVNSLMEIGKNNLQMDLYVTWKITKVH